MENSTVLFSNKPGLITLLSIILELWDICKVKQQKPSGV